MTNDYDAILAKRDELRARNAQAQEMLIAAATTPTSVEVERPRLPHLILDIYNLKVHAQEFMETMGIAYQHAVPQSMFDSWWFFNCENIPDPLPDCLKFMRSTPQECVGRGLSQQNADAINAKTAGISPMHSEQATGHATIGDV